MFAVGLIARVVSGGRTQVPLAVVAAICAFGAASPPAHARELPRVIQTVPGVPGMRFVADGIPFQTDASGRAYPPEALVGSSARLLALKTEIAPGVRARFDRWYGDGGIAALNLDYRVDIGFVDLDGNRVDPGVVGSVTLAGSNGRRQSFVGGAPQWLQGNRVVPESGGRRSTAVSYAADRVLVGGSTVVHRGQQRFFPAHDRSVRLRLLLFSARFIVRDALLGFPIGSAVRLEYPSGLVQRHGLDRGADLTVRSLPRGDYRVSVDALGISSSRPVALSGDQRVELRVISWLDIVVVLLGLGSLALGLLYLRRPRRAATLASALVLAAAASMAITPPVRAADRPDPLFAYYYIWFNGSSWERAKTDYPLLGRYSSDDRGVMRQHVRWAKRAGIDGFIVSWKSTPVLNRRLERLAEVAAAERFKLLVIYQGLDFFREPLPAARVARDLDFFERHFASREAFGAFRKPLVIWSGSWRFSRHELAAVTQSRRDSLLILASERNVDGYRRVAGSVDGNAYYWASVDPTTYPGHAEKLAELGRAVHSRHGIWIAPAAPGFDARLVGGTSVVGRRSGATLREELDAATNSSPDAIGLISWNEFSENTHVEPSLDHGSRYLDVVADVRRASPAGEGEFDSSEPAATDVNYGVPLLGGLALFLIGSVGLLAASASHPSEVGKSPIVGLWLPAAEAYRRSTGVIRTSLAVCTSALALLSLALPAAATAYEPQLTRYPYLTDVVGSRGIVNWATDRSQSSGRVRYGEVGLESCTAHVRTAAKTSITVNGVRQYQWRAQLSGLRPGARYCYRVEFGTGTSVIDLLGARSVALVPGAAARRRLASRSRSRCWVTGARPATPRPVPGTGRPM